MQKSILTILLFGIWGQCLFAQNIINIALIRDDGSERTLFFESSIKAEIESLFSGKYQVSFQSFNTALSTGQGSAYIQDIYERGDIDMLIGLGLNVCNRLIKRTSHDKPTILSIILDNELLGIPVSAEGTSGIKNLTYIQSPFNVVRDLQKLSDIIPFKKLGIVLGNSFDQRNFDFDTFWKRSLSSIGADFVYLPVDNNTDQLLASIPQDVEAVYVLPVFNDWPANEQRNFFDGLSEKGIPSFTLLSSPSIDLGAYAGYDTDANFEKMPRRIALNVLKIVEGQAAEDLPVRMDNFIENLIINMATVRKSGVYPNWDLLADAILLNVNNFDNKESLSLRGAVAEGLENNLDLKIAAKETLISDREVKIANSNFLPQLDASSTLVGLDENSVRRSFGTQGRFNLTANATLSQLVFSEPAMANVAIQKLLLESQKQNQTQSELDVILDVGLAYLNILQATTLVDLRNQNVNTTRKNYDIAKTKERVGYSGPNDVYRWQSELALDNVDLNNAQAQLQQARYNLNVFLNRPIADPIPLANGVYQDSILQIIDGRLFALIRSPGDIEILSNFMVAESFSNLPEIKQISLAIAAQQRSLKSQKRAFYLPSIALGAEYNYPIGNYQFPEDVMPMEGVSTYNAGLSVQFPLFQGNSRKYQKEQTEIDILQLEDRLADLRNKLEFQVRSNIQIAGASYSNLSLSQEAAEAAGKNFEIAQDSYQQGLLNITSLIDAQNAFFQAEINATNAAYTFIQDFMKVERSIGYYHFLAIPEDQNAFLQRFVEFLTNK